MKIDKSQLKKSLSNWRFWVIILPVMMSLLAQLVFEGLAFITKIPLSIFERIANDIAYNKLIKSIMDWAQNNQ